DRPVLRLGAPSGGVDAFVFEQEQSVGHVPGDHRVMDLTLEFPGLEEGDLPKITDLDGGQRGHRHATRVGRGSPIVPGFAAVSAAETYAGRYCDVVVVASRRLRRCCRLSM